MAPRAFNLKNYIVSQLRRASYRTPMYGEAKKHARVAYGLYQCAGCGAAYGPKDVQVDHIETVIPTGGWDDFNGYIERLFCPASGLQILCRGCHQVKSNTENKTRRTRK